MGFLLFFLNALHEYYKNNFLDVIGFVLTVIGGGFALVQWRDAIKNNRARYVKELLSLIMDDEKIQQFLYISDYGKDWYTKEFHRDETHEIARICDRTLFTYNYICYLYDIKEINQKELEIFTYYMLSLGHDKQLTCYFLDLYQYSIHNGTKFPFDHYLSFCERNGCVSREVRNKDFFFYYLNEESKANEKSPSIDVPEETKKILEQVGDRLYIKTISRCENCTHYLKEEKRCDANKMIALHQWVGENDKCEKFNINGDLDNWHYSLESSEKKL